MSSLRIHIMSRYNNLSKAEKKAADYLLEHLDEIYSIPIAQLAESSGVSSGTWVRLCKSLGFSGLKDLKKALFDKATEAHPLEDNSSLVFTDIKDHKNTRHIIDSIEASSIQAIQNSLQLIEPKTLEEAAKAIMQANNIRLFGVGASALVAIDLYHKLLRIGLNANFTNDFHIQLTAAATMEKSDLAIIVSNSGATKEMIEIQKLVHKSDAKTLVITSVGKNPLSKSADLILTTSSPEIHMRSGAMSSRIAQLAVVDCLFTTLANKNYEQVEANLEKSHAASAPHRVSY